MENAPEFLENIDNNLTYYEIPTQMSCAYLKGHLTGRALDWFEVLDYRVVEDKAIDCAHLKQSLIEQFRVVRNKSDLETRVYASSQKHNQKPSDFWNSVIQKEARAIVSLTGVGKKIGGRREVTTAIADRPDNSRPQRGFNRFERQGDSDNRRFDSRRRGGQSDHRFHNQGG
ncbi:uncharacterized protein TNCV_4024391 [Trichonephila clavipes]|uniref:Retrotransposon gag domain-containing protein n=1 Tax=Trichonephila clavipes TaxID=2585209 RepID=A0A8X6WDK5_TRICX|nr:uncharacterized protein TNCV_4024391 [Trichonephila clavipes]